MARFLPMRVLAALLTLLLVALTGCEPSDCNDCTDGDTAADCADCPSDTEKFGKLQGDVRIDGDSVVCLVAAFENDALVEEGFTDEDPMELEADVYEVFAGNPDITDTQGHPIHTEPDDTRWVAPSQKVEIVKGETAQVAFDLNVYHLLEDVECGYDSYYHDGTEWVYDDYTSLGKQTIEVQQGYLVTTTGHHGLGTIGTTDDYIVQGTRVLLQTSNDKMSLESAELTDSHFAATVINTQMNFRNELLCE